MASFLLHHHLFVPFTLIAGMAWGLFATLALFGFSMFLVRRIFGDRHHGWTRVSGLPYGGDVHRHRIGGIGSAEPPSRLSCRGC